MYHHQLSHHQQILIMMTIEITLMRGLKLQGEIYNNNKIELSQRVSNDALLSTIIWTNKRL